MATMVKNLTEIQISKLRSESYEAGDYAMGAICDKALNNGAFEPDDYTTLTAAESARIVGMSLEDVYAAIAEAINDAAAQAPDETAKRFEVLVVGDVNSETVGESLASYDTAEAAKAVAGRESGRFTFGTCIRDNETGLIDWGGGFGRTFDVETQSWTGGATYSPGMVAAREWASSASAGDYLVEYEDTGMTAEEDPGSRCGYDDQQLDEIRALLRKRDLTLEADDRGLMAQARHVEE